MSNEFILLAPTAFQVFRAGESNPQRAKRIVYGQATSDANGIATLYFTANGLANGNPLLTTINYAVSSVYSTNSSVNARPRVQMREKNVTAKYVSANVTNVGSVVMPGILVDFMILGNFDS